MADAHLHDVVFGDRADDPRIVGVPGEVGNLGGVAAVDEEEFGRTVLGVLGRLLLANLGQVPNVESAIGAGRGQDGLVVGRPLNLKQNLLLKGTFSWKKVNFC